MNRHEKKITAVVALIVGLVFAFTVAGGIFTMRGRLPSEKPLVSGR